MNKLWKPRRKLNDDGIGLMGSSSRLLPLYRLLSLFLRLSFLSVNKNTVQSKVNRQSTDVVDRHPRCRSSNQISAGLSNVSRPILRPTQTTDGPECVQVRKGPVGMERRLDGMSDVINRFILFIFLSFPLYFLWKIDKYDYTLFIQWSLTFKKRSTVIGRVTSVPAHKYQLEIEYFRCSPPSKE